MANITGGKILAYSVLPGFWPRIRDLLGSGFSYFAYFLAVIYNNVGLLPSGHAFLNPQNFGRFGIRHVIFAATDNLVISRENSDRVIIYFTLLAGLMILLLQIILLGFAALSSSVYAAPPPPTWTNLFVTTPWGPSQDIAMIVLDRVFGVMSITGPGGFFGSCYSDLAVDCLDLRGTTNPLPSVFPQPFHIALHQMFKFYSSGIALISLMVILYFVVAIIGETISSGTPFGQRFNKAWFIPRLIVFAVLITPVNLTGVNAGINGAQYITLGVAKFGSNMGTNAWARFSNSIQTQYASDGVSTMFGNKGTLIAYPNMPSVAKIGQFMFLARMCMYAEKMLNDKEIRGYLVRETDTHLLKGTNTTPLINFVPFLDLSGNIVFSFADAVKFSRNGSVVLRFGELNLPDSVSAQTPISDFGVIPGSYEREWGYVKPICGELVFDFQSVNPIVTGDAAIYGIQENYYNSIREYLLYDPTYDTAAYCMVRAILPYDVDPACVDEGVTHDFNNATMWGAHSAPGSYPSVVSSTKWATGPLIRNSIDYYDTVNKFYITRNFTVGGTSYTGTTSNPLFSASVIGLMRANYDFSIPNVILQRGWVGMSIYYQKIAEVNGLIFSSVQNTPNISKFPMVMELVGQQHDSQDTNPNLDERFNPLLQNGKLADLPRPGDHYMAAALYSGYRMWQDGDLSSAFNKGKSSNIVIDSINALFGTDGLFNMLNNSDVHPLAQLSALGRSMLESSIRNIFIGSSVGLVSDILENKFSVSMGALPKVAGEFASRIGMVGITIGFLLFYVLPFLPFVYFFFAFGGWIKAIFEAMVAMPLWALAHIKIDGNGLPGPMATNGYFLLFEIFLRPTMIVFGFLASITIFTAAVSSLNTVYEVVVLSVSGYDLKENVYKGPQLGGMGTPTTEMLRGPIDQLFYTIVYAIIVYMMALSCFKLIDQIPSSIMRFMGVTVSTFQERSGDSGGELMTRMSRTSQITKAQLNMAIDQIKGVAGKDHVKDVMRQQQMMDAMNKK